MNVSPTSRVRVHAADRGMTLIELIIAIVLSTMIGGVIVAALITSLNVSSATSEQVSDSTDAGLISSFLTRDAQSAGGLDPANALPDGTGVSTDPSDADGIACAGQPLVLKLRFSWINRSASAAAKVVVSYALDGERQLVRRVCTNGVDTDVVMGRNVSSARATCIPAPATEFCSGHPTFVSLTVEGSGSRAPFLYTLTASLRSAISQLTIVGPASLPAGQRGAAYTPTQMTTIGAVGTSTWSAAGLPLGLEIDPVTGVIWGTVDASVRGSFDVTITVTDTSPTTATRLYTIAILAPPDAVPDAYSVNEDSSLSVPAPGVLTNDSSDGTKTAILYSGVANGALVFRSDGSFTYTPRANFSGTDLFMYKVTDGSLGSNIVTVTLTVNPVNDAPINRVPVAQRTLKNISKVFVNSGRISISDIDAAGAIVQVQLNAINGTVTLPNETGLASSAGSATATMTITGTVANLNLSLANATFTPNTDFIGAAALQIVTNDLGNTGVGGALADTDSIDIAVTDSALGIFTDNADISSPFKPGDSTFADPNYTVSNGKGELGGNADGFQYLFRSLTGDGRLTARVLAFDANGNGAQAGVMFRETLDVGSRHATIDITNRDKAEFLFRSGTGQTTTFVSYPGPAAPYWLRLTRIGNVFTAERSADGVTWVASSPTTITMASTIYIGLAVTAHSNSDNLATAVFDQVAITTPPAAFADAYSVNEDTTLVVDVDNGVLANDSDPEGDTLSAAIVTGLMGVTLNADGSFAYVPPANFTGTASFTYRADDAALNSPPATVTLTVDPANETPSFVRGADQIVAADAGVTVVTEWATAISQGSGETDQLVDFIVANSDNSIFSVQPVLSADGTLTYAIAAGASGAATVSVSIHDNGGTANGGADTSVVQTFNIFVVFPPVVVATSESLAYTENGTLLLDPQVAVTDPDSANLASARVTMTTAYVNGQDTLTFVNQNGITGTWTPATGVLALSGSASVANYQSALRSITYTNTSQAPEPTTRAVAFVANDGMIDSTIASRTITIAAVNDAPVNTVPGAQAIAKNAAKVFTAATLISINDVDAGEAIVRVELVSTNGTTSLSGVAGLTFIVGDGTTDSSMTFTGTIAAINQAMSGLRYYPTNNFVGSASLQIVTNDQGNTGNGVVGTDTDTIAITVGAPVVTATVGNAAHTENVATIVDPTITVVDADSANLSSATVTLTTGYVGTQDVLGFINQNGITGTWTASSGELALSGSATVARYQAALRSVTYNNTSNAPTTTTRTITFVVNDGLVSSNTASRNVTVTAANDAPAVTATVGSMAYTENGTTALDPTITIIDADSTNLSSATVDLTTNYVAAQDTLAFTTQNGITGTYTMATGVMTLSGSSSVANYQAALRSITYGNNSNTPTTTTRTVTFVVNDGALPSNMASRTITVAAVNDDPVNTVPGSQSMVRNTIKTFSGTTLISISDVDAGTTNAVQVRLISTNGTVTLSGTGGLTFKPGDSGTADADMTFTGTITNVRARLNGLKFNAANVAGSANLTIITSDQGWTGSGGTLTDSDTIAITLT